MPISDYPGQIFIVSAPSGVGKTTIIRSALEQWPEVRYSVSCTTRPPRAGEAAGKDYHFLTRPEFLQGIDSGRFLEWARVHGEYYGTDKGPVEAWLMAGRDIVLDIDVQGAMQVRCTYPHAGTIFIVPPSMKVLEERLNHRGTESDEQIRTRFAAAVRELQQAPWYDYLIVNDVLKDAVSDFNAILRAGRCRRDIQVSRLREFFLREFHS